MISISRGSNKLKDGRERQFLNNRIFHHKVFIQHFLISTMLFVITKVLHPREKGWKISHRSHTAVKTNSEALNFSCILFYSWYLLMDAQFGLHIIIVSLVFRTVPETRHFSRAI